MAKGCKAIIGDLGPLARGPAAGVGAIAVRRCQLSRLEVKSEAFNRMRQMGRADLYICSTAAGFPICVCNVYAWHGAHDSARARERENGRAVWGGCAKP
eukprot:1401675-Alexandrium_andersonii.AAC.1